MLKNAKKFNTLKKDYRIKSNKIIKLKKELGNLKSNYLEKKKEVEEQNMRMKKLNKIYFQFMKKLIKF